MTIAIVKNEIVRRGYRAVTIATTDGGYNTRLYVNCHPYRADEDLGDATHIAKTFTSLRCAQKWADLTLAAR